MRRFRPASTVLGAIAVSAVVGGLFGPRAFATDDRVPEHYKNFSAALSAIQANYVDEIESDALVYGAIRGMLGTLDPHSSFFDPKEYAQMRERQEGRYYGLGITISAIDGDITAQRVFENSPAYRVGIRLGDVIAKINGDDAKNWTTEQAMLKLRGAKGTTVNVEVRRRGYQDLIPLSVTRDEVHILTVQSHFMIDDAVGYIHMKDFGENTEREVQASLRDLKSKGMKRLILDVRGNPGGPLDQAIKVSNLFLPRGKMIVYTRGRTGNADQDYRGTDDGQFTDIPMVVITNRDSASASEIVAGALQDHDRAYIVGETTFGKALVQSVYRVSGNAGLALTTAHYYTPSGRLIQRPWDASFDEYLSYRLRDQDPTKQHDPGDLKRTDAGRPVYSGGGIEPDRHLAGPVEGFNPTPFGRMLYQRGAFESYAVKFMARGDTQISQPANGRRLVDHGFQVDEAMIADFRGQLKTDRFRIDDASFQKDLEFIKAMIGFRVDEVVFSMAEARKRLLAVDPQAQLAIAAFSDAENLSGLGRGTNRAQ